ncbi:TonB-dependent receptor plug domain-containing protein [Hymenobacter armeniacus]|uniref:TonB-dependent receptor plug domain-containing protein n=1 Tax=Hymenobacter armeniacus TaxID=2771358 RepID=A0ABR8JSC9_9BACT|nr:TonB-dependent receptor plug domain-containing protein [Hymenobacter armeniacus]MBD2722872.1 TonB-dependent receptor plug domain-containing protein [Hymenobacter armeniacus]
MNRLLPTTFLVLAVAGVQAQQVDTLAPRRVAVATAIPDSVEAVVLPLRFSCGTSCVLISAVSPWTPPPFLTLQPLLPQVPGVQVTPTSGAPGDWATVRIRGGSSLASPDQPLYVVDGVPALNADFEPGVFLRAAFPLGSGPQLAHTGANPLPTLPPEDIASVTVLSGGIAAAQYGAQGSNGVIEIVTKRGGKTGQRQPLRVRYAGIGGVQQVRQRYDLLNARQYADLANEASQKPNGGGLVRYPLTGPISPDTDWQGELFRPAVLHGHHLTLDGSSVRTRFLLSADYLNQAGVVTHSGLDRYALRLNLDQQISPKLRLFLNASAASVSQTLPTDATVAQALLAPPTVAVHDARGNFERYGPFFNQRNPVDLATNDGTATTSRRLLLQAGAEYILWPGVVLTGSLGREEGRVASETHFLVNTSIGQQTTATAVSTLRLPTTASVAQLRLAYDHTFGEAHRLGLTASAGYQDYQRNTNGTYREPGSESYYSTSSTTTFSNAGLTATYAYRGRYEALASLRRDANSGATLLFVPKVPALWLPAAEVRWYLHQESFLADAPAISTATLWAGVGQTSSTSLPGTGWGSGVTSDYLRLGPGQVVSTLGSSAPEPAPPRTTQLEAGLRLGLWQNRLMVDVTTYRRSTAHLVVPQLLVLPTGTGLGALVLPREAALRNQGLLLSVSGSWQAGRFRGFSRLAAAWQQQRVADLLAVPDAGPVPGLVVGEAPHPFFLYHRLPVAAAGAVDAQGRNIGGRLRYQDVDANGFITDADASYQGTALPTQLYSFSQTLALGRFTLDAQLDAQAGHQLLNTTLATLDLPTGYTNGTTRLLDRWTPTHYSPDVPEANVGLANSVALNQRYDDAQLQSAAHLRLSQLTFSYALRPAAHPHPMSVWVGGQNLFVLSSYRGFDPNVSSGGATLLAAGYDANAYPVPRTWLLGVRASF